MDETILRTAEAGDRDALRAMQALSLRVLAAPHYPAHAIEAFIDRIGTMDDDLIEDGTYHCVVWRGEIVGCGGWSTRRPSYSVHEAGPAAGPGARRATVRSVYVHPRWARRGLGRRVMDKIEADITAAGFPRAELTATLAGVPLYRRLGYREDRLVRLDLGRGVSFRGIAMWKPLDGMLAGERSAA